MASQTSRTHPLPTTPQTSVTPSQMIHVNIFDHADFMTRCRIVGDDVPRASLSDYSLGAKAEVSSAVQEHILPEHSSDRELQYSHECSRRSPKCITCADPIRRREDDTISDHVETRARGDVSRETSPRAREHSVEACTQMNHQILHFN